MPGAGRFGRPSKPIAIAVGILILLIAAWLVFTRLSATFSDRYESFYPSIAEADKDGAITHDRRPALRGGLVKGARILLSHVKVEWIEGESSSVGEKSRYRSLTSGQNVPSRYQQEGAYLPE